MDPTGQVSEILRVKRNAVVSLVKCPLTQKFHETLLRHVRDLSRKVASMDSSIRAMNAELLVTVNSMQSITHSVDAQTQILSQILATSSVNVDKIFKLLENRILKVLEASGLSLHNLDIRSLQTLHGLNQFKNDFAHCLFHPPGFPPEVRGINVSRPL